ncbi:MAG: Tricarboxylate transport protein TctC [Betaproteobacteria bacterium]|jgi:tripartite-type tricarboxylate transporter receptor subunit TctC|nr:Tricarboxylate transport protein TctC [Betaproteobacteria bacterium]
MKKTWITRFALSVLLPTAAFGFAAGPALGQVFPTKPIAFIVPYGPGTGNDVIARLISNKVTENWAQPIVVDNRPGAAGAIGTDLTAKAAPDGHTILIASTSQILNQFISKVNYDILKDFAPVIVPGTLPYVLAVPNASPAKSIKELVAFAKSMPGKVNYAGTFGSLPHFLGEMLKTAGGIDITLINYKSTPDAVPDVLANRVEIWFTTMASAVPLAKAGRVKVLGVAGKQRAAVLPDVPTMAEAGFPTLDVSASFYVLAPAATPSTVVAALNREMAKALASPDVKEKLAAAGVAEKSTTPEEASAMLKTEVAGWAKVVKESGVKME